MEPYFALIFLSLASTLLALLTVSQGRRQGRTPGSAQPAIAAEQAEAFLRSRNEAELAAAMLAWSCRNVELLSSVLRGMSAAQAEWLLQQGAEALQMSPEARGEVLNRLGGRLLQRMVAEHPDVLAELYFQDVPEAPRSQERPQPQAAGASPGRARRAA
jgi:hypothetical protein